MCYGTIDGKPGNMNTMVEGWMANTPGNPVYDSYQARQKANQPGGPAPAAPRPLTIAQPEQAPAPNTSVSPDPSLFIPTSATRLAGVTKGSGLNVPR